MKVLTVSSLLFLTLSAGLPCRAAEAGNASQWTDPDTHLMWTAADNGQGLSWSQALRHCGSLNVLGFRDWQLPSVEDLQNIFDPAQNRNGYRIKAPIALTGWQWSSTPGSQKGEAWAFDFGDGGRASVAAGDSGLNRALCVRKVH